MIRHIFQKYDVRIVRRVDEQLWDGAGMSRCSTQDDYQFPIFAWCMKRKAEILKEMGR